MNQNLQNILELQTALTQLHEAEQRLHGIPDWMRELHEEHTAREDGDRALEETAAEAARQRRAAEAAVQDAQEKLKKYQQQINKVSTQREYGALLQEIDTVKGQITDQRGGRLLGPRPAREGRQGARRPARELPRHRGALRRGDGPLGGGEARGGAPGGGAQGPGRRPQEAACRAAWSRSSSASSTATPAARRRRCGRSSAPARSSASGTARPATTACGRRWWSRSATATPWSSATPASASSSSPRRSRPERRVAADRLAERLARIRGRIEDACGRAGRPAGGVTLLGASKTQPAPALAEAFQAGLRVFGENRVQEGLAKSRELPPEIAGQIDWHLIGPLQSNKVRAALDLFRTIHSDRPPPHRRGDRPRGRRARRSPSPASSRSTSAARRASTASRRTGSPRRSGR